MPTRTWAIITGEYPPDHGGVSDYTYQLARQLAKAGDQVHVWTPATLDEAAPNQGITLHRLPGRFGLRALYTMDKQIRILPATSRILVQYVPHAYGYRAMNVPFCLWLWLQRRLPVWVMFHEASVFFKRSQPLKHNFIAVVNRVMAWLITHSAERLFVSVPGWTPILKPLLPRGLQLEWAPVPTNLPTQADTELAKELRAQITDQPDRTVIGHFGTFSSVTMPALTAILPRLLSKQNLFCVLVGRGGREFAAALIHDHPPLDGRLFATGGMPPERVVAQLVACDLIIQPYPDGVSGRRTSLMASLALGLPIVTNSGPLTEPVWTERSAVAIAPDCDEGFIALTESLLNDSAARGRIARNARETYVACFDIQRTIEKLRGTTSSV